MWVNQQRDINFAKAIKNYREEKHTAFFCCCCSSEQFRPLLFILFSDVIYIAVLVIIVLIIFYYKSMFKNLYIFFAFLFLALIHEYWGRTITRTLFWGYPEENAYETSSGWAFGAGDLRWVNCNDRSRSRIMYYARISYMLIFRAESEI